MRVFSGMTVRNKSDRGGLSNVLLKGLFVIVCIVGTIWFGLQVYKADFERQLYEAVKTDDLESFQWYQKLGADWRTPVKDFEEFNMVTWVAQCGAVKIFNHLLKDGYDIEFVNRYSHTPLFIAAERGHGALACALLDAGAQSSRDYTYRDPDEGDWIILKDQHVVHIAAESGLVGVCEQLIADGLSVDYENAVGLTPLCYAAVQGQTELVKRLLELGADADHESSPLKFALIRKHYEVAELLLERGANPNSLSDRFHKLLSLARANGAGYYSKYEYLGFTNPWMKHPLTMAVDSRDVALVKLLIQHGADIHYATEIGNTALHLAAQREAKDIILCLLQSGADKEVLNGLRLTPYGVAFKANRDDLGELIRRFVDIN